MAIRRGAVRRFVRNRLSEAVESRDFASGSNGEFPIRTGRVGISCMRLPLT